ncbi:MAG: hypothetical protein MR678_02990, partial [Muribaculaceae bacterium]|nr:hypothetical protein [Muribaculaceae bacterium]
ERDVGHIFHGRKHHWPVAQIYVAYLHNRLFVPQNYCKPSAMQNQNTFVLDFALPRRRVIYPKSLQAERNAKSGKLAF